MKQIERIKSLLTSLPEKDRILGEQFIDNRNFESLRDLVDSAIYRVRKQKQLHVTNQTTPNSEYINLDLSDLNSLKAEVDTYLLQLETPVSVGTSDCIGDAVCYWEDYEEY